MSTKQKSARSLILLTYVVFATSACLELQESTKKTGGECTACHGDESRRGNELRRAAPPFDLDGNTKPSSPGVGAHAQHLTNEGHAEIACEECHVVPNSVYARGHLDSDFPAEVVFGSLAKHGGTSPEYRLHTRQCGNTYCHGSEAPIWTEIATASRSCDRCHGFPPALPHPRETDCSLCHGEVVDRALDFVDDRLHVNGNVEVRFRAACSSCHGRDGLGAPPPDTSGQESPQSFGVGAHMAHVKTNGTHRIVGCDECHTVPSAADDPMHLDGNPRAEVVFGNLARRNEAEPKYNSADGRCGNTYCHGSSSPIWIAPRSSEDSCGSCHGLPPALPHTQDRDCSRCHGAVIGADGKIVAPELHVDGSVQLANLPECAQCHGTGSSGRVPPDLAGNVTPTARGVGAHARHLDASNTHAAIPCSSCHLQPARVDSAGHLDADGRAELFFSGLATTNGHVPAYDATNLTCSNTYCHGTAVANWTSPRASAEICGSCHGLPPALPHPPRSDCESCHGEVAGRNLTILAADRHVNGRLELAPTGCSLCHGSSTNPAPPADLSGFSERQRIGVGAHQSHLNGGRFGRPVGCQECHAVPQAVEDPGHLDDFQRAEVVFTGPATARGRFPTWSHEGATCGNTYCHDPSGISVPVPPWTSSASMECTTCHGLPPPEPHPQLSQCAFCHRSVDVNLQIVDRVRHIDGVVDF